MKGDSEEILEGFLIGLLIICVMLAFGVFRP